jgi:hypothetical protein
MKTGKVVMEQKSPGHEMLKTSTSCHCSAGSGLGNNSDEKDVSFFEPDLSVLLAPVRYLPFTRVCLKVKQRLEIMINGMMLRVEDLKTSCLRRRQERSQASGHGPL